MFDEGSAGKAPAPSVVVRGLADAACREVGFRRAEARVAKQISASEVLVAYAIRTTAAVSIRLAIHVRRQAIAGVPEELDGKGRAPKRYSKPLSDRVVKYAGQWLGWPMSKGQTLGASTSDQVVAEAVMYEAKASGHADVEFVKTDIYEIPPDKTGPYDIVMSTIGVISWMPDLKGFFEVIGRLTKPGGHIFIEETHPVLMMYEEGEGDEPSYLKYSYFKNDPWVESKGLDYYEGTEYESSPHYSF